MSVPHLCLRIVRYSFFALFALVPLLLTPWNYELFEYNKMMAVYLLSAIIGTSWGIKMLEEGEIRVARTPLDIPIALFVGSMLASSLFSIDSHVSWFGYYSRFNGGMWSIISYVLLYYAFVSNFLPESLRQNSARAKSKHETHGITVSEADPPSHGHVLRFLGTALITGLVVALYGVAERLGIDKHLWVQDVQTRVFSTLGQPNWLAAYLVALSPVAWYFWLKTQTVIPGNKQMKYGVTWSLPSVFWALTSIVLFLVLLFTRSRSGLVGLAVADIMFWGFLFLNAAHRKSVRAAILLHIFFAVIIFFNGSHIAAVDRYATLNGWRQALQKNFEPAKVITQKSETPAAGPALEVGGTESGTIRKYVWQGAVNAWRSSVKTMILGTGTETFAFAFYQWRPPEHNQTSEWDFLYNKAHNEYLNYLATTGILGLGSYLLFISAFIWRFLAWNIKNKTEHISPLELSLFAGWLSILVTNFFGFSVVVVQVFLFLFPAMVFVLHSDSLRIYARGIRLPAWSTWLIALGGVLLVVRLLTLWYADTLFANGYRFNRTGNFQAARMNLATAIALNPGEPVYRDEIATSLMSLAGTAMETQDATLAATLARDALTQNDAAIRIADRNVNFWKTRTKIYYTFSSFDPKLNDAAITALARARELSPNDPKMYYNLAILYGRNGENEKAVELLQKARQLKRDYRDAYNGLYVFYTELNKPADARAILEYYLTSVNAEDKEFKDILTKGSTP